MKILWLADALRDAGLTVIEHPNWTTHARPYSWNPLFGVVHATAAPSWQPDNVQVSIVRNGRSDLKGPIANACVDHWGRWHVLSAGYCNTTLEGTAGPFRGKGNTNALGVEACNDNLSEPWPAIQYDAYAIGWAAICRRLGWRASRLVGHREHTPGHKTDPTFGMNAFRDRVQWYIDNPGAANVAGEEDPMYTNAHSNLDRSVADLFDANKSEWLAAGGTEQTWQEMVAAGMVGGNGRINRLGTAIKSLAADVAEIKAALKAEPEPTPVVVDATQVAEALAGNEAFRTMIREMAFEGSQRSESE